MKEFCDSSNVKRPFNASDVTKGLSFMEVLLYGPDHAPFADSYVVNFSGIAIFMVLIVVHGALLVISQ